MLRLTKPLLPERRYSPAIPFVFLIALAAYASLSQHEASQAVANYSGNQHGHWKEIGDMLGGLFNWFFKDSISVYTLVLAALTASLVKLGWNQIDLTTALERPWLFIEDIWLTGFDAESSHGPQLNFMLKNIGRSHARVVKLRGGILARTAPVTAEDVPLNDTPLDAAFTLTFEASDKSKTTVATLKVIDSAALEKINSGAANVVVRGIFE